MQGFYFGDDKPCNASIGGVACDMFSYTPTQVRCGARVAVCLWLVSDCFLVFPSARSLCARFLVPFAPSSASYLAQSTPDSITLSRLPSGLALTSFFWSFTAQFVCSTRFAAVPNGGVVKVQVTRLIDKVKSNTVNFQYDGQCPFIPFHSVHSALLVCRPLCTSASPSFGRVSRLAACGGCCAPSWLEGLCPPAAASFLCGS